MYYHDVNVSFAKHEELEICVSDKKVSVVSFKAKGYDTTQAHRQTHTSLLTGRIAH